MLRIASGNVVQSRCISRDNQRSHQRTDLRAGFSRYRVV